MRVSDSFRIARAVATYISNYKWYYWRFLLAIKTTLATLNESDNSYYRSSIKEFVFCKN